MDNSEKKAAKAQRIEEKQKARQEKKAEKQQYKEALKKERRYGINARIGWEKLDNTAFQIGRAHV